MILLETIKHSRKKKGILNLLVKRISFVRIHTFSHCRIRRKREKTNNKHKILEKPQQVASNTF